MTLARKPYARISPADIGQVDRELKKLEQMSAGLYVPKVLVAARSPYTVQGTDTMLLCDCTAGPITLTFPLAARVEGMTVVVVKSDTSANAVTLSGTFSGGVNPKITAAHAGYTVSAMNGVYHVTAGVTYPVIVGETGVTNMLYPYGDFRRHGATMGGLTDDVAAINATITSAQALGRNSVLAPPGDCLCNSGRIIVPSGITIYGIPTQGEYDGGAYTHGTRLIRTNAGTASEPIIQLSTSSACIGLECRWQKTGGALQGIVRFGESGVFVTYAKYQGVIRGTRTGDINGTTTCRGFVFPDSGDAKYFNEIDAIASECDVSLSMGQLANANKINLTSREAHLHCDLNATAGQVVENDITLRMFAIQALVPAYGIRNHNTQGNMIRGIYEAYGSCFYADDGTSTSDRFDMYVNEATASYVPVASADTRYQRPINVDRFQAMYLPINTTGDRLVFGRGNRAEFFRNITGTLPWTNRVAGTLAAADSNCKKIIQFPSVYTKASLNSVRGRIRVYAYAPFNLSMSFVDVEFMYRNANQSTAAGQLSVLRVSQKGSGITGLYFCTGVAAATSFSIALVGGNTGSNTSFDAISVTLETEAVTYSTNVVEMDLFHGMTFVSTSVTASDVTDGISLLTVADTTV